MKDKTRDCHYAASFLHTDDDMTVAFPSLWLCTISFCFVFICPFRALFSLLLDLLFQDLDVVCEAGDGGLESLVDEFVSYCSIHTAPEL
jgi:hypothetical protein